jgi:Na+/serine symporter
MTAWSVVVYPYGLGQSCFCTNVKLFGFGVQTHCFKHKNSFTHNYMQKFAPIVDFILHFWCKKNPFGMLQTEFNTICHKEIFPQHFSYRTFLIVGCAGSNLFTTTCITFIFPLVPLYFAKFPINYFCHRNRPIFTSAQFFTFSLLKNRQ